MDFGRSSRRQFSTLLGSAAAVWPFRANAQGRKRRIGMLMGVAEGDPEGERWVQAFLQAMQALGWQRDTNVHIDLRWGASNLDRMAGFAKELVALQPDLIHVTTTPAVAAILRETHNIPVVFGVVLDPVGSGFVPSLSHPDANVTGFSNFEPSLAGKWVQLLREIAPSVSRIVMLFNPETAPQAVFLWAAVEFCVRKTRNRQTCCSISKRCRYPTNSNCLGAGNGPHCGPGHL